MMYGTPGVSLVVRAVRRIVYSRHDSQFDTYGNSRAGDGLASLGLVKRPSVAPKQ